MIGKNQSRRDDIISIGYMIIFLMKRNLPWLRIKASNVEEIFIKKYLILKKILN